MSAFVDKGKQQRSNDACQTPSSKDATMDGAKLFGAKEVTQICRHTGETAAVASNDNVDECLEEEAISYACQHIESYDLDGKEQHVSIATTNVVRQGGPSDTTATI